MEKTEYETDLVRRPIVEIIDKNQGLSQRDLMVIHSYITIRGKMIITREEAALLYFELHKFIMSTK